MREVEREREKESITLPSQEAEWKWGRGGGFERQMKAVYAQWQAVFNGHYDNEISHPIVPKHSLEVPSQDCEYHVLCSLILMSSANGVQIGSTTELWMGRGTPRILKQEQDC